MPAIKIPLGCLAVLCLSCAPPLRDPFGQSLLQGREAAASSPESLTVDLGVSVRQKGTPPFSARLYARPHRQYRLDAFGFSSQVEASYLWSAGDWLLLLNARREVWAGRGDTLDLGETGLRLPNVHALFGFLWGEPLPGFNARDSGSLSRSGDTLRWKFQGVPWEARFDTIRGTCLEAHSPSLGLRYRDYRRDGDRVLPGEVEVSMPGQPALVLKVEKVENLPQWKRNPFVLQAPEGYERRDSGFPPDNGGEK